LSGADINLRSNQQFCFEICELRDIFLRKTGTKYFPGPWTSSTEKHGGQLKIFLFGEKKRTRTEFAKQNTLSKRAVSYFFTTEATEVKRAGGNEKIARFGHSVRSIVTCDIP